MISPLEILLVEDNTHDVELILRALQRCHLAHKLIHVEDGQAALDFLFCDGAYAGRNPRQQPKVVFLDLKLPKLNGIQVLREIRADERTKMQPVVILTSSREDRDVIETYQLGANSYIVKPVDFENFIDVLSHLGLYWTTLNEPPTLKP